MPGGARLVVGRSADGFFALDGICPHAGAVLADGLLDGELLICPLHAFAFEIASGLCVDDASCSIRRHDVRVEGGVVQVRVVDG